jgi:flavin reductase (DIM6/NTAB) family NADH-FMN oxidoreductase RutF/rubredoxin
MNIESYFKINYGIYIVSTYDGKRKNGYVSNTVFQVTSEPTQLAASCSKNNLTTHMIASSGKFSVSILHQQASPELIGLFGYKSGYDVDKFSSVMHIPGQTGTPIVIEDTVAWFDCEVVHSFDVGTHILFIGKVIDCDVIDHDHIPMSYSWYREFRKGMSPKNAPTYVDPAKISHKKETDKSKGKRYQCLACNFIYDPEIGDPDGGISAGTAFEDIPDHWVCPVCGATKDMFEEMAW